MRKTSLNKKGKSPTTKAKNRIQAALRRKAIARDGGCVMRHYQSQLPHQYLDCGPYRTDGEIVLQAEHLVTRADSRSYADMDNIVCLCMRHHFYFKKQHGAIYWHIIRQHIGEERWEKVQAWEADRSPHRVYLKEWEQIAEALQ